jgi:hypothetical protein
MGEINGLQRNIMELPLLYKMFMRERAKKNMFRKRVLYLLLYVCCLVSAACASSSAPTQSPVSSPQPKPTATATAQPTASSLPAGTVLYQANWSQGLSQWRASGDWKVVQDQLDVTANNLSQITIPYRPDMHNYAIEVRLEIVRLLKGEAGSWTIFGTRQDGKDGFRATVSGVKGTEDRISGSHGQVEIWLDPFTAMPPGSGIPNDYDPGFRWHTYTIEVRDNSARLLDNGIQLSQVSSADTYYLSNGPLGMTCQWLEVRVSSIRILSL